MTIAFIGLGSNLGDREATIRAALDRLAATPGVRVLAVSRLRDTEPVGGPPGQPRFLNGVARLETTLSARSLLDLLLATEAALGRVRTAGGGSSEPRWGPRTIDLDLLLFDEERIDEVGLTVPHPRILERPFVFEPLGELAPELLDALRRGRYASPMRWVDSIEAMRDFSRAARRAGKTIGFVPTMGALHEGHLSLVRRARAENDLAVASIFVNELQFGPNEDFARYPRDADGDRALLAPAGCDAVFSAPAEAMYPAGFRTYVVQDDLAAKLEGASRPGHFRGVLTVVLKLFQIVVPDRAYFGQKDFQQTVVLRRMVRDLDVPVEVVVAPTVREPDGLAMSSRNRYLSPEERREAPALSRGLLRAQALFAGGERRAVALSGAIEATIGESPRAEIDYVRIVDPDSLDPVDPVRAGSCAVLAVRFGGTRLLDNLVFQ